MAASELSRVIQTLRQAAHPHQGAGLSDGQLLESYVRGREEAAFAALVHRHGPMVWGVCRRVLSNHQDAEDAFQATFLVLVRKAASVANVPNWLYGVAHRTALKARTTTARRGAREKHLSIMPEPAVERHETWDDLRPVLDRELSRLPAKYRAIIVLCDLEGKTRKEAARHFHLPEGTVATRLATARTMLARRLARSGLIVSAAALAAVLSQNAVSAGLLASLASSTIKVASLFAVGPAAPSGVISVKAVALAEGVLKTMLLTKLKIATAVLAVLLAAGGLIGKGLAVFNEPGLGAALPQPKREPQNQVGKDRPFTIDEITGKMLRELGNRFDVAIVGRTDGIVSGTDVYFYDSAIEAAAVHAGLVKRGEMAVVTVTVVKCPRSGVGSTQNGVRSSRWDGARAGDTAFVLQRRAEKKGAADARGNGGRPGQ